MYENSCECFEWRTVFYCKRFTYFGSIKQIFSMLTISGRKSETVWRWSLQRTTLNNNLLAEVCALRLESICFFSLLFDYFNCCDWPQKQSATFRWHIQFYYSDVDEYGFKRDCNFDYDAYDSIMTNYYKVLTKRGLKWQSMMKNPPNFHNRKSSKLKRYVRKGIPGILIFDQSSFE